MRSDSRALLLIVCAAAVPLAGGCTLFGVESSRTETVSGTPSEGRLERLEDKVDRLERRLKALEAERGAQGR